MASMMFWVSTGSLLMAMMGADPVGCSTWSEWFLLSLIPEMMLLSSAWLTSWPSGTEKRVMLPPVKSIPRLSFPLIPMNTRPPTMSKIESVNAALRLLRKSMALLGTRFMNLMFLRMPRSDAHQKRTRVQSSEASSVPRIPMVSVTANPLTDPDACQKRMTAVMSVVTLASKMATKAFS